MRACTEYWTTRRHSEERDCCELTCCSRPATKTPSILGWTASQSSSTIRTCFSPFRLAHVHIAWFEWWWLYTMMFTSTAMQAVLGQLLDVGSLLTFCIQVPRQESIKVAENKITNVIKLKHTLQLVPKLRSALQTSQHPMFRTFCQVGQWILY